MAGRSLRILVRIDWAAGAIPTSRLWDGGGPWMDQDGEIWSGAGALGDLDQIEHAINGEAAGVTITLSGVERNEADLAWLSYTNDEIVGSTVSFLLQGCDDDDQPVGDPEIRFTGTIDDIGFKDTVAQNRPLSTIQAPVVNKFTVRHLSSGAVLSDVDQRARSAVINPEADPDLICDRVAGLQDKTITWPRWN